MRVDYMDKELRVFIAINFSENTKMELSHIVCRFKKNALSGNFTRKENFHLTLTFIGETSEVEKIKSAMDQALQIFKASCFELNLEGFGSFNRSEGDILWIGIEKNLILNEIHKAIVVELKKKGFKLEDRAFKPHLTIGRKVVMNETFVQPPFAPIKSNVDRISLMKSEHINGKLVYSEIYSTRLQ
jgi:2'-5' RNA ligase